MNIGRAAYSAYILGCPYTDFENNVLLQQMSGSIVGELNHSRMFAAKFRRSVFEVVKRRVKKFLQTPLKQTGHLPPVGISADKGTYKHRSRQFLSCITVIPGGDNLLEVLTCGQPVVTDGSSGEQLSVNMKSGFDKFGIQSVQVESGVFDGVYFHCNVEEHLNDIYKFEEGKVLYSWDPLHKTGLVDKHVTNESSFEWLQDIITICQQIFHSFNWGASYEKFREATVLWKLSLRNLVTFSETRFANSKRKVFKNILHEFAPAITCLENQIIAGERNRQGLEAADTNGREKGIQARELKGKILNVRFLLSLAGLVDIYEQYGAIVNATQMVHLLPHERLDKYIKAVGQMDIMVSTMNHSDCAKYAEKMVQKKTCLWPTYHETLATYKEKGTIQELIVLDEEPVRAAGLGVVTRRNYIKRGNESTETQVNDRLHKLVSKLATGLDAEKIYSKEGKAVIEQTRVILDLPSMALKLKKPGSSPIQVAVKEFPKFKQAVAKIPVHDLKEIPEEELKLQHRKFIERLAEMTKDFDVKELKGVDAKELIKAFFKPDDELFFGIEMIMQAMAVSSVKHSCESIVESFVSKYENHFDQRRNVDEDTANEEFTIAVNGPNLANCTGVVKEAMNLHFKDKPWHFIRTSILERVVKHDGGSAVMDRMMNEGTLPFMK